MMESIAVEAIRQIPAFLLAILAFYFYRAAKKSETVANEPAQIPAELKSQVQEAAGAVEQLQTDFQAIRESVQAFEEFKNAIQESDESVRAQLSNQKMALKEFGRVLSKTSEQTYTEFGSLEERLGRIEESLRERGMIEDENRSAAA